MTSKPSRPRKAQPKAPTGPHLAPELFTELNATFYQDDPSEYLLTKIEALTLMFAPDEALAPAYAADRRIGVTHLGGMAVASKEARDRYVRTECVLVLHHACEMLLRLFFAHAEKQDCPWLGMAASVSFAEFKEKVSAALRNGFNRDAVSVVFLGGTDSRDAVIRAEDDEFDDGVHAVQLLLAFSAQTVLAESFLYNAAKHGLTVVQTDEATKTSLHPDGADPLQLHAGPQFAYLHKPQFPNAPKNKGLPEWHMSLTNTLPDQDIGVALLIQRAVSSLWDVARRRYTGESGQVHVIPTAAVHDIISGPARASGQQVRTHTLELAKKDAAGNFLGVDVRLSSPRLPGDGEWEPGASANAPTSRIVDLPARQRDRQLVSTSNRHLLPISPSWSSRV
ncbi:hypothetical protein C6A86_017095 [Mycobacterium sp. ITM-2016-00316]|uniref:hypothetical protein n=1 Tax=Mycobacterium sp. ITM-2016-00316 TaxID=2099695 RepID=UPI000CF8F03C|nr:hypothetical protein [Mycobacterium sp. ITM-2016-00316]WNG79982.1 hypothetical protein C6A86_017095 [Mycobacterium sp. ITM-2016-00316]